MKLSTEESYRINYFIYLVDQVLFSLQSRFEQLKMYKDNFGFLYNVEKLKLLDDDNLKKNCLNLEDFLKHDMLSDIDGLDLFSELQVLKEIINVDIKTPLETLDFIFKKKKKSEFCSNYMDCL